MNRYARTASRVASAGLAIIFLTLLVCIIGGASTIARAVDRVEAAVKVSQLYETLERRLWTEASLVRVHGLDAQGSGWYEERAAAIETENTLDAIRANAGGNDGAIVAATLADHDRYIDVLLVLFSQIDASSPSAAQTFKHSSQIFERMQSRIDKRASEQHDVAVASLESLAQTQRVTIRMIIAASILGISALAVCVLVIAAYRSTIERARRTEVERLGQFSLTDNLTGLGNHRAYQNDLVREISRLERHGATMSLALIDVDDFKGVNDRMGHVHGDAVLAALGDLLRSLRKTDAGFRLGGDEFGVILQHTSLDDAVAVMERIRKEAPERLFGATLSIGIANANGGAGSQIDPISLRAQADAALYAAKSLGRNSVMTYADAQSNALILSPDKERAVRQLIDTGSLDVAFQPIWDVHRASPIGFEALARPHRDFGIDGPAEAFDIAERIGKAPELDLVCIRAVLAHAHELPPDALLFINVVPETLNRGQLAGSRLAELAAAAGIDPQRVVIELTERAMNRLDVIVHEAKRLQTMGFKLALDDTGAGNAGLEVLRRLAVDFVKIDRVVLMQAMADPISRAIVSGIVAIARAMNSYIIAEGVETAESLDFIYRDVMHPPPRPSDSFAVQGYLLGRPGRSPWNDGHESSAEVLLRCVAGVSTVSA